MDGFRVVTLLVSEREAVSARNKQQPFQGLSKEICFISNLDESGIYFCAYKGLLHENNITIHHLEALPLRNGCRGM